jgi:DNA repair exonuclease SbcCD ATPase subunit
LRQEFQEATEAFEKIDKASVRVEAGAMVETDPEALAIADNFEVTKAKIAALKQKYTGLTIAGIEDRKGYEMVHAARMELRGYRTATEKIRKALKEESLARGRKIDSVAKELTGLLLEIETPLDAEESRIDAERERIKQEKQREADAKLQKRIEALQAVGAPFVLSELVQMTDTQFGFVLASATDAWEAKEAARKDAEAKAKAFEEQQAREAAERAERERKEREAKEAAEAAERARIKAEQEAEAKRLAEEREAIRKEREAIEAQKRAQEQQAREQRIREEEAAKAKAEAERKAREEAEAKERAAAAEKARQEAEAKRLAEIEAARPDADKIRALAQVVREIALPKLSTPAGQTAITEIEGWIARLAKSIDGKADTLSPITPKAP